MQNKLRRGAPTVYTCVSSCICYPATCDRKGHGSGGLLQNIHILSQISLTDLSRSPLPPSHPAKKKAHQTIKPKTKARAQSDRLTPEPATLSSPRPPQTRARPPFPPPSPLSLTPGRSEVRRLAGAGGGGALPTRGGGGDIHPFAACRALCFLGQILACANREPRQFLYLTVIWLYVWPFFATHPSTGHVWLTVLCYPPHYAHMGVAEHLASM